MGLSLGTTFSYSASFIKLEEEAQSVFAVSYVAYNFDKYDYEPKLLNKVFAIDKSSHLMIYQPKYYVFTWKKGSVPSKGNIYANTNISAEEISKMFDHCYKYLHKNTLTPEQINAGWVTKDWAKENILKYLEKATEYMYELGYNNFDRSKYPIKNSPNFSFERFDKLPDDITINFKMPLDGILENSSIQNFCVEIDVIRESDISVEDSSINWSVAKYYSSDVETDEGLEQVLSVDGLDLVEINHINLLIDALNMYVRFTNDPDEFVKDMHSCERLLLFEDTHNDDVVFGPDIKPFCI